MRQVEEQRPKITPRDDKRQSEYFITEGMVKKGSAEKLEKDISNEILASMIYKKLFKDGHGTSELPRSVQKPTKVAGYYTLKGNFSSDTGVADKKPEVEAFNFIDGSTLSNVQYFGKESLVVKVSAEITKVVDLIETANEAVIRKKLQATQRNYLLHGPPGTGKTQFVMWLVYILDVNLKHRKLMNQLGKAAYLKLSLSDRLETIKSMKSLARGVFIKPSDLVSKFVGQTEKNIQQLFKAAGSAPEYQVTILFLDEIDAFFSVRKEDSPEHSASAKTEFLNTIGGAHDNPKTPIFLFGATNLYDNLDAAFKRRFANKLTFSLPDAKERERLIRSGLSFNEQDIEPCLKTLIKVSEGMAHSKIMEILTRLSFDTEGDITSHSPEEIVEAFKYQKNHLEGIDGDKDVEIPKSLRNYYFIG